MSDTAETKPEAEVTPAVLLEPVPEPTPEPTPGPEPVKMAAPAIQAKRESGVGAFSGMILGGLIAGALGYGAGQVWPMFQSSTADLAALRTEVAALTATAAPVDSRIADLAARLDALDAAVPADVAGIEARLDGVEAALVASPAPNAAIKALQDEVARLKLAPARAVSMDTSALKAEADAILAEARAQGAALAAVTRQAAALDRLQAAMDSGAPFGASLADLTNPPAILTGLAATGVPSVTGLRDAFPDVARAGLEAAIQADMGDSWTERALSFLQSTTGARSTTPRAGNDPDAVLSRAEAAVAAGDLATALSEIAALPAEARVVMAPWVAQAQIRLDALAAVADLTAKIGG